MKNNIDDAFIRRFNSMLKFSFPDAAQRALIWKKSLPQKALFKLKPGVVNDNNFPHDIRDNNESADIPESVKKYELTGGNILNVVHYAGIKAVEALYELEKRSKKEEWEGANINLPGQRNHDYSDNGKSQLIIYLSDILDGVKRELIKEGKPFSG